MGDQSQPVAEQQRRKRTLIRGPKEFRDIRADLPKPKRADALARQRGSLSIHRNPGWRLHALFIKGSNGERMEAAEINDWCERAPSDE